MIASDGGGALTFNGEIYNYIELAAELEQRRISTRGSSDTAVLLALGLAEGADAMPRVRGMFAFGLWNARTNRLLLVRDRLGKKPLYYAEQDGCLYFASTLDALRHGLAAEWPVDADAIALYLRLGYVPAPWSAYRGVAKLAAAHLLEIEIEKGLPNPRRYWSADPPPAAATSFDAAVDAVDAAVQDAVALRLRSDVPLGILLSGGVDSSLVAAVAARQSASRLLTFSIGFSEREYDELPYARRVAQAIGTDHREFHATPALFELLPDFVRHFGEPFADSSALNLWLLARETRRHVTVALAGDGGDEVFGGYDWYLRAAQFARLAGALPPRGAQAAAAVLAPFERAGLRPAAMARRGLGFLATADRGLRFARQRTLLSAELAATLFGPKLRSAMAGDADRLLQALYWRAPGDALQRMRTVDLETYLADCLLPKVDVASMAHALEVRSPLLDSHVVELGLAMPQSFLVGRGRGKLLLRRLADRYLPAGILERPKMGFTMPVAVWMRRELRGDVQSLANDSALLAGGWIERAGLRRLLDEHDSGVRDHGDRLFALLVLNQWLGTA